LQENWGICESGNPAQMKWIASRTEGIFLPVAVGERSEKNTG